MPRPRLLIVLVYLAAAAPLAACGGSDKPPAEQASPATVSSDQRGVLDTIDALQAASRKGDGQAICRGIFTPELSRSVAAAAKRSCAGEVRSKLFSPQAEISVSRDIQLNGNQATAMVRDQNGRVSKLFMVKRGGRWQIDRVQPQPA